MYRLNGALGSPYSLTMRALLRYRRIAHVWVHGADSRDALAKVRAPVIPVVEYPDGTFHNDSTPLIYDLEARHPDRSVRSDAWPTCARAMPHSTLRPARGSIRCWRKRDASPR